MLQIFPDQVDDVLDVASLPPTDNTELNYRPRPLSAGQELRLTLLLLVVALPAAVVLGVSLHFACEIIPILRHVTVATAIILATWLGIRRLTGALQDIDLIYGLLLAFACASSVYWEWTTAHDLEAFRVALVICWVTSSLLTRQVAAWILVAPTVDHVTLECWRPNVPTLIPSQLSRQCPELLTYAASPLLLFATWCLSLLLLLEIEAGLWFWPVTFAASAQFVWLVWHILAIPFVPFPKPDDSFRATWRAIIVFLTYDIHRTPAAGVFRFPTRWLRSPWTRWALFVSTLMAIGLGHGASCPNPFQVWYEGGSYSMQLLANLVMISLAGPLVFCSTLWLVGGTLLARFESELLQHKNSDVSDWDNYVDRILNSEDDLEREHLFLGASEKADYPILVHREIHDQHGHVLGDSGASKTALAMGPQATQLIARADSTVVIIDLKGDRALFESCRREAARTGKMKFRWISNEVGKTTFGFNPFIQSHNTFLTVEQLTQELLQGLSLDYGIQYGAGYFTAMNEIVLNSVLGATGDRSFRELSDHLSDRDWYERIGYKEDWKQARHLGALVKRLAASQAINLVPEMFPEQPEVHENAIDVLNLYDEPQVVYLWLRSAVEPTNAPAIARLFLWSMFAAASHRSSNRNRVYFFIDEMQQILSDGIKLIFEQFRDMGGTIIAAHQTAGQLRRQGTDLGATIDSCTAVKQIFRASDLDSLERMTRLSGLKREAAANWYQPFERGSGDLVKRFSEVHADEGLVRVGEQERERYDRADLQAISSRRHSSLVRFTFGSGYTQFAGKSIAIKSPYHISFDEYLKRRDKPWPMDPGAFVIQPPSPPKSDESGSSADSTEEGEFEFGDEFDQRGKAAAL